MPDPDTHIQGAHAVELSRDQAEISSLVEQVLDRAEDAGFGESSLFAIRLAIEEGITNAFEHGHTELDDSATIRFEYAVSPQAVEIAIEDQGPGFDPAKLPDPTLLENLSKPSGRGVMLMRAYMSEVRFNPKGNRVRMRYARPNA